MPPLPHTAPEKPRNLDRTVPCRTETGQNARGGGNRMPRILTSSAPRRAGPRHTYIHTLHTVSTLQDTSAEQRCRLPPCCFAHSSHGRLVGRGGMGVTSRLLTLALRWRLLVTTGIYGVRERAMTGGELWSNSVAHGVSPPGTSV